MPVVSGRPFRPLVSFRAHFPGARCAHPRLPSWRLSGPFHWVAGRAVMIQRRARSADWPAAHRFSLAACKAVMIQRRAGPTDRPLFSLAAGRAAMLQRRARAVARPSRSRPPPWNRRAPSHQALQGRHNPLIANSLYHDGCRSMVTISGRPFRPLPFFLHPFRGLAALTPGYRTDRPAGPPSSFRGALPVGSLRAPTATQLVGLSGLFHWAAGGGRPPFRVVPSPGRGRNERRQTPPVVRPHSRR